MTANWEWDGFSLPLKQPLDQETHKGSHLSHHKDQKGQHVPHSAGRGGPGVSREELNLCLFVLRDHSLWLSSAGKMSSHPPCADLPYSSKQRHQKKPKGKQSRTSLRIKAPPGSLTGMPKIQRSKRQKREDPKQSKKHPALTPLSSKMLNKFGHFDDSLQVSLFWGC